MSASLNIRDEHLLKLLVSGPCIFQNLWDNAKAYFTSEEAMRQRLSLLGQAGYIVSKRYEDKGNNKFALYVLGQAGVNFLSSERHYQPDQIRIMLPSDHTVAHELVVTDVVRRLSRESLHIPYSLRYYDDPVCRKYQKLLGLTGPTVPDLMVELRCRWIGYPYRILFEVHMGTVPLLNIVDKATKHRDWQIVYLCTNHNDMFNLKSALQESIEKLKVKIYFAVMTDFCEAPGGIFGTDYTTLDNRRVSLYP